MIDLYLDLIIELVFLMRYHGYIVLICTGRSMGGVPRGCVFYLMATGGFELEHSSKDILGTCIVGALSYLTPLMHWYGVLEQINLSH